MQVRANRGPRLLNICGAHFEYKLVMVTLKDPDNFFL